MERSLFDTVSMLGLDIMLAVIAALAALSALMRVVQRWRERMSADEREDERQTERHERPAAGYAPSLSIGLTPRAPVPDAAVVPDWIMAWMRRDPARDAAGARSGCANPAASGGVRVSLEFESAQTSER